MNYFLLAWQYFFPKFQAEVGNCLNKEGSSLLSSRKAVKCSPSDWDRKERKRLKYYQVQPVFLSCGTHWNVLSDASNTAEQGSTLVHTQISTVTTSHPISEGKNHSLWLFFILEMLRIIVKLHFSPEKASKQKNYSFWPPKRVFFLIFFPSKIDAYLNTSFFNYLPQDPNFSSRKLWTKSKDWLDFSTFWRFQKQFMFTFSL